MTGSDITRLVRDLPDRPGVYLWKSETGKVLYVGKAKSLRKRVSSYLRTRGLDARMQELMAEARDLETIVTSTEREALILEATLIKRHQPKYNIALKDDRRHVWVRVDTKAPIPSFVATRETEGADGALFFGPYGSIRRLEKTLDTLRRYIPVAMCRDPASQQRECIDFHIGRCAGPCRGHISVDEYRRLVDEMILFLEGREEQLLSILRGEMEEAASRLEFERAAVLRDRIDDIVRLLRHQRVFDIEGRDRDIVGIARTEEAALIELLTIRGGRLIGTDSFLFDVGLDVTDSELLTTFVKQYYSSLPRLPEEVLLPIDIEERELLENLFSDGRSHGMRLLTPDTGPDLDLIEMANTNAVQALHKILILGDSKAPVVDEGVKQLREVLGLNRAPLHIEGFDIANIQGTTPAGSCVVFRNGAPDKTSYRMFRIRSKETPDDYAMMREVVRRRYRSVLEAGEALPDLIVIDGGKGQLSSALSALTSVGLDYLPVVSIAKREEILFTRDQPGGIVLPAESPALRLIQRVRDEAHRFAQRYYHTLRQRVLTGSILEDAPGIGPKRRAALLRKFGSLDAVCTASVEDLADTPGMTPAAARALREWLIQEGLVPKEDACGTQT